MQDNQDSGHFSQEELDAIVSGTVTPKMPVDLGTPQEQSPEKPIWDTADVALSVPRGVVGFGKSIYNLADTVSFDLLPDWHTNPLGSSQSHVGGLVEGLSQFVSGFATGGLALRGAALVPGAVGKAAAWLGGAGGGTAAVVRGGMVKGGIADFISFEGAEGRLSDILVEFDNPVLNNTVTQYLASDMDDSELEGRLKNVLEGAVLGVALEGIVAGVKGSAKAIRKYRQAKAAGVPEEDAVRAAMEVAGDDLEQASRMLEEQPDSVTQFGSLGEPVSNQVSVSFSGTDAATGSASTDGIKMTVNGGYGQSFSIPLSRSSRTPTTIVNDVNGPGRAITNSVVGEVSIDDAVRFSREFGKLSGEQSDPLLDTIMSSVVERLKAQSDGLRIYVSNDLAGKRPFFRGEFNPYIVVHPEAMGSRTLVHEMLHALTSKDLQTVIREVRAPGMSVESVGRGYLTGLAKLVGSPSATIRQQSIKDLADLFLFVNGFGTKTADSSWKKTASEFSRFGKLAANEFDFSKWPSVIGGQQVTSEIAYGLTNLDEFIAQAYSSKEFQDFLRSIKLDGSARFQTFTNAWEKFVSIVRSLIPGLGEQNGETALDRTFKIVEEIVSMRGYSPAGIVDPKTVSGTPIEGLMRSMSSRRTSASMVGPEAVRGLIESSEQLPLDSFKPEGAAWVDSPATSSAATPARDVSPPSTDEWKKWFLNSAVVDDRGRPQRMFHGTTDAGFSSFRVVGKEGSLGAGAYFTSSPETAGRYATDAGDIQSGSGVYQVWLSIQNPLSSSRNIDYDKWVNNSIIKQYGAQGEVLRFQKETSMISLLERIVARNEPRLPSHEIQLKVQKSLRDMGFDGVDYRMPSGERWIVAWDQGQIKDVNNSKPNRELAEINAAPPRTGGPNYGVEEARSVNVPEATAASVRELEDLINTGAGADVISARIEQLREQGIINLRPVIQSGTPGAYAEALVALRQVEANEGRFGPTARRSNAENTRAGMAQLQAAMESGGLNVPEVMKAIQDGVATIKDFNERLPFFLGLETAFRYEAVQALRSGRGDTDEVMRAFTMVSGSTRKIKSYLGKNLQMVQAFGDMDVVRRSWESLDPKQRRVLMNQYADTLEMLVVDPQTGKEMAKVLTEGMVTKGGRIGAELFRNSILSGPKTLAVNIWSAVEALALPMERGLGRLGAGQRDQALREFGTLARYSSEAKDALTAFKTSFMEEGDSVALGRGNTQFGDLQPSRAIASRNFARLNSVDPATGGVRRTIAGLAVDFVGQVVNMPMRAMGSSDEFFTTMMARAEADVVLRRIVSQERKLPMTSSAVSLEVERLKKLLFVDGQLYTRRTVVERGMRLARDKHLPESFRETLTDSVAARMELDRTDPAVVSEVSRLFNLAVSNNKVKPASELRKSKDATVLVQSLDAAGQRARANPMFIPEVQRYVDQNWDAYADSDYMQAGLGKNLQQQTGQDYRLLQKASAEVERRVREATWKREYDDMAESSVLGTQLVGNIGKATASAVSHVPLLQLVVPFIRTPTNLLAFVTDRNPVGRAYSWWQAAKAGDKDAAAEAAGRLATGTVLYTTGIVLAANGMLTGRGPKDPDLRKQLLASGWQPYSFRLGDTYLSYGRNDPISTFLGLVADTYEIAANTYDPTPEDQDALMKVATAVVGSVANNVTNKSYLRGIVTTLGALTGDEAEWQKLQRQYAGALVPNFLAQVDQTTLDPDIREVRSMMDAIRSRVPVFGETVDRLRNPLGEPIKGNETAYSIFLPGTASTRTKDPVKRELADSLISVGSPRSTLPGGIDLRTIKLKNGQSAYDRLQELTGQVKVGGKTVRDQLAALIQSPFYKELPALGQDDISSPRVSLVRGYVGNYRKAAMQQLLKESPELARAVAHSRELKASMLR